MDCIFRICGYIPSHGFCTRCEPLNKIFEFVGYKGSDSSYASQNVLLSYAVLKADDALREKAGRITRLGANIISKIYRKRLSRTLNEIIEKSNETIKKLESSNIDAETYILQLSKIGEEIFENSPRRRINPVELNAFGSSIIAATTAYDIVADIKSDIKYGQFNPLKIENDPTAKGEKLLNEYFDIFKEKMRPIMSPKYASSYINKQGTNALFSQFCPCGLPCGVPCYC